MSEVFSLIPVNSMASLTKSSFRLSVVRICIMMHHRCRRFKCHAPVWDRHEKSNKRGIGKNRRTAKMVGGGAALGHADWRRCGRRERRGHWGPRQVRLELRALPRLQRPEDVGFVAVLKFFAGHASGASRGPTPTINHLYVGGRLFGFRVARVAAGLLALGLLGYH